jgi:hypothetical protein
MLRLASPQQYTIQLHDGGYKLSSNGVQCKFEAPASTRGVAKLYTLSRNRSLVYVGIAKQPMSSRLNHGFKANGKGGYHGYKWKLLRDPLKLSVWTAQGAETGATIRELEIVEAEVAFLCRQQSGQWPEYQHEIHFYPSAERHHTAAKTVYEHAVGEASHSFNRNSEACPTVPVNSYVKWQRTSKPHA